MQKHHQTIKFVLTFVITILIVSTGYYAEATIYYVKEGATGTSCANWQNACSSLQTALGMVSSGDSIWVAKGTYKPSSSIQSLLSKIILFLILSISPLYLKSSI